MTLALIILDGWGLREEREANAVKLGKVPTFNHLWESGTYATTTLGASGECVGLPVGQIGGSEVGHQNIGAGTMIYTDLTYINKQIESAAYLTNPVLVETMDRAKNNVGTLHLMGLVSDGGVHSHLQHIFALCRMAKERGIKKLALHAFTDGRDVPPTSGKDHVRALRNYLIELGVGRVATVIGRYYAMDRDKRWERTQAAYKALVDGVADHTANDPVLAVEESYTAGKTDEFMLPYVILTDGKPTATIRDGDTIIGFNFRGDRMRQIFWALTDPGFTGFERKPLRDVHFISMASWGDEIKAPLAFVNPPQETCLAEVLAKAGKTQLHLAETEKYPHVTFFFNGKRDTAFDSEDRFLEPSPKFVPTYDKKPQMSAVALTEQALDAIRSRKYDFILLNYANPDMVGHTGVLEAAITAVETVDGQLKRLLEALAEIGATVLVTADHGNCEMMVDPETGLPHTAHTMNRVPLILITPDGSRPKLQAGNLCNLSPTILQLMGLAMPPAFDAESLIVE